MTDPYAGPTDPDVEAMQVKTVRLTPAMIRRIDALGHREGFSGVVREALSNWLDHDEDHDKLMRDAVLALRTLEQVIGYLQANSK